MANKKSPLVMVSTGQDKLLRTRRFLRWVIVILFVAALAWVYYQLEQPTTLPIKQVDIEGSFPHLNQQAFEKALAPYAVGGFFNVDVNQLKQQALKFPWVYQIDVKKLFPDTLVIMITEQTPVAQWNNNALINADGDVFTPALTSFPANLPLFFGPPDQASMMLATYERMNQALQPLNLHITRIKLSERGSWRLQLNNGLNVILGRILIWQRLQRFIEVYPQIFTNAKYKPLSADMRYTNGVAVHWSWQRMKK